MPYRDSKYTRFSRPTGSKNTLSSNNPAPPEPSSNSTNPDYRLWHLIDQSLISALLSTISLVVLPYILNLTTTHEIWTNLEHLLQSTNMSRVIQLKNEIHYVQMYDNTMTQYLTHIKTLVDNIAAAGSHIDVEDIILYIINGLPSSYNSFKNAIRTTHLPPTDQP